tara:strand:- start:2193 stop:2444 length:252 start_codon:yes stop_codon:yes gene_type:complete
MEAACRIELDNTQTLAHIKRAISIPIPIPKTNSYKDINLCEEYSLKCNNFNPSKMSPPDDWKDRLQLRIQNYSCITGSNEKNK